MVQRIAFRDGLVLNLDDYNELDVFVPLTLTLPEIYSADAEVVTIDPTAPRTEERPLFDFAGSTCTHADWDDDGTLHLQFSDGHEIEVRSDEHRTAWELYGNTTATPRACRTATCASSAPMCRRMRRRALKANGGASSASG